MQVSILPYGITAVRTSVLRILEERHRAAPKRPFRSAAEFGPFWNEASALYGGDDLALAVASELPVGGFGRTSYAIASAANVGEALRVFCRDAQRAVTGMTAELLGVRKDAELILRGPQQLWPIFEILIAVLALRLRQLAEPAVELAEVRLPRPAPRDVAPWLHVFAVRPKFDADHAAFRLPSLLLERPLRTADPAVRDALGTSSLQTMRDQVAAHIRAWVREAPDADQVARSLGLSRRTLQRRLVDENVSFRDIVLSVKVDVARQLLEREHLSVAEIADAVGFSRVAAFSRAFAKYTGVSPTEFREQALRRNAKR